MIRHEIEQNLSTFFWLMKFVFKSKKIALQFVSYILLISIIEALRDLDYEKSNG
jgi:hypothetical protein